MGMAITTRRNYPDLPAPVVAAMDKGEISKSWGLYEDDNDRASAWLWMHSYLPLGALGPPSVVSFELAISKTAMPHANFDPAAHRIDVALGRMRRAERIVTRPGGILVPMSRRTRR